MCVYLTADFKIHEATTGRIGRKNRHIHSHSWRLQHIPSVTDRMCIPQKINKGKLEKRQQSNIKMRNGRTEFGVLQANIIGHCIYLGYEDSNPHSAFTTKTFVVVVTPHPRIFF